MNNHRLKSPSESLSMLARVLEHGSGTARIEIREDKCFRADQWLRVGTISAYPNDDDNNEDERNRFEQAIFFGAFSWTIPAFDTLIDECIASFPEKDLNPAKKAAQRDKTRRALEGLVHCAARCGFVNPTFDAGSVADMPFSRPTTVVADTSAILQGGLDFVVRFLYPMARIKVPAIAHMEILNMADRYFTHRRCTDNKFIPANALLDHATSQAAQRVLLRLELQTETEIERPRLGADPLRGIVHNESDAEDSALGLQRVQRSFADRLILETAIHHRDRLSPDHPIVVLTADQGLARMTLAEGVQSLFFSAPAASQVCGTTLPATCFRPLATEAVDSPFFYISLPTLVWELACTFGAARLISDDGSCSFSVAAIGELLPWHPFHSKDDLLWTSSTAPDLGGQSDTESNVVEDDGRSAKTANDSVTREGKGAQKASSRPHTTTLTGAYRFAVDSMISLVLAFDRRERLMDRDGMRIVGLTTGKRYADLRNFLISGSFVEKIDDGLKKRAVMDDLVESIKTLSLARLHDLLLNVPSYKAFVGELRQGAPTKPEEVKSISQSAVRTYVVLAEISCAALDIAGEGIFATPVNPPAREFAALALEAYRRLKNGEQYVLTGKWLEQLARQHGIHPIRARERLNEAREAGLLERYTEGSTPETQFELHSMEMLEKEKGAVTVRTLKLYHGDFLIPGKASVSIRLEEKRQ
jgi:hypothetical protein